MRGLCIAAGYFAISDRGIQGRSWILLGAGPESLRAAKSRSNPASPCGNVLPTHITHHCDNILHASLCSVTLGFRIFVLADRSIGNRASTWGLAVFDVLY